MDEHASRPTRRRVLAGAASVGAAVTAGCLILDSSESDGPSHRGVCEVIVASIVDESAGETRVRVEIQRDGELVYDETHELASYRMVHLLAVEHDWLGDDVPYRITVAAETSTEPFVYDTGEEEPARSCRGFHAMVGRGGITGGGVYGSGVDDRSVGQR